MPAAGAADREQSCLDFLRSVPSAVSGRRVAAALGISPTTAGAVLDSLQRQRLVTGRVAGTSVLWSLAPDPAPAPASRDGLPVVVVLTALALEHHAVRALLADTDTVITATGSRFAAGTLPGRETDWHLHVAEIGMGNAAAAAETASAVAHLRPRLVVFLGVAGGLKPQDQARGDVVVADRVYGLHSGKATDEGFSTRPLSFSAPHRLSQLVREVARDWRPPSMPGMRRRASRVHVRPIVAGEVVLAGEHTDLRRLLGERHNDAAAIDMESFGTYEAAHRADVPVLAIRGLSDLVGDKRPGADKVWQPRAAAAAAAFLAALLGSATEKDLGAAPAPAAPGAGGQESGWDAEDVLGGLPPHVRPWARRLGQARGRDQRGPLAELARQSPHPRAWLGRLKHRPPAWLREDSSGDAWALVASYADAHRAPAAAHAYQQAAAAAAAADLHALAGIHAMRAALAAIRYPADPSQTAEQTRADALAALDAHDLATVLPVARFVRAAAAEDARSIGPLGAAALGALAVDPSLAQDDAADRAGAHAGDPDLDGLADLARTDSDVHAHLQADVLALVASVHLVAGRTEQALAALRQARAAAPDLPGLALAEARARLQRLAEPPPPADISAQLDDIEQAAALVRRSRRRWGGPTADALSVAARARALTGDAQGALRMLLPRPAGSADDDEAADPGVADTGAACALAAGDAALSLEFAGRITDPVDRQIARAAALARLPGMTNEAQEAFRDVLALAVDSRPDRTVRALVGLTALRVPLLEPPPRGLADHLDRLRRADPAAADLVEASDALDRGKWRDALVLARRHPGSVPASHLAAQALASSGQAQDAVRILEQAARGSGDDGLLAHALQVASQNGLNQDARRLAHTLTASRSPSVRRDAVQALIALAQQDGDWDEVALRCRQLLEGDGPPAATESARWQLAAAEYNLRRFPQAREVLDRPVQAVPRSPAEALLLLAVVKAAPGPRPDDDVRRALDIAERWPDDERVGADVLALIAISGRGTNDDALLVRARSQQEAFFAAFPDTTLMQRVDVGEDAAGLVEYLRKSLAPAAPELDQLARRAWLGQYPLAVLADATGRSYAELLIRRDLGLVVVVSDTDGPDQERLAVEKAGRALDRGAVADLSVIALAPDAHDEPDHLFAELPRVLLPARARDDLLGAASALSIRSAGSVSWDAERERPVFREHPPELTERWERRSAELRRLLRHFEAVPQQDAQPLRHWDAAIVLAGTLGLPLWADDAALRALARSEGIDVFGTLDLLAALDQRGDGTGGARARAIERLVGISAVDLPVGHRLLQFAADDDWAPVGYAALLLARPANWRSPQEGFARYRSVLRGLPDQRRGPVERAQWFEAAAGGLAWAASPAARADAVGALMAWTALDAGPAEYLPPLLEAAVRVLATSAPGSDPIESFAAAATAALLDLLDPADVAVAFTRLISELDAEPRLAMMQAFMGGRRP